eukprot:CAMPEP_0113940244 /NCGR_PEP_ID=MMETSP1339-20121228/6411_1 /TAXON_ID=94617 /ORGANISM="Fibrocapsa japonica" /LENGTH=283 /DNA_ID=CAMNT_0000944001 /DNA_START=14 /DNA_END=865 /DNA_ORIENTATION=- /assembly_acc=CAM_ASM_000762
MLSKAIRIGASLPPPPSSILRRFASLTPSYDTVIAEVKGKVGLITLNRPKVNALCDALFDDLIHAAQALDADPNIGAMVITGSQKAFAGGADIAEMSTRGFAEVYNNNMFAQWIEVAKLSKPTIAAVNGFALGGGCELAMMCDIIIAGENAKFAQPEIKLGVIPGAGGTQRLVRAVGKSRAMELCLTGDMFTAQQASDWGLVSRVVPKADTVDEAIKLAEKISKFSQPVAKMVKEAVNASYEMSLQEGLKFERRLFHSNFALNDQKEGMKAFLEKREANFTNA